MEHPSLASVLHRLGQIGFAVLFVVALCTPNWQNSLFSWWPLWEYNNAGASGATVGLLTLLSVAAALLWISNRFVLWRFHPGSPWQWGPRGFWLPFAGLSLLGLLSLHPSSFILLPSSFRLQPSTFSLQLFYLAMIGVAWLVYLYLMNERPPLIIAIGAILLIQGASTIVQFYLQHEIGLERLGEPVLDLSVEGTSVLWARGRNWLRGYGLTSHPNVLGAILCICLLLYLPQLAKWSQWPLHRQILFLLVALTGIAGLFLSFSRAAWLALAVGVLTWLLMWRLQRQRPQPDQPTVKRRPHTILIGLLLILPTLWLFITYSDLAFSRFVNLESDIEAKSIAERVGSAETALQLIAAHPWLGVGLGRFVAAAQSIDPDVGRVHNVPLLVAAELGIIGLLLWLWLVLAPFWRWWRPSARASMRPSPIQLAPWVAMIVLNLFDTTLWLGENWQTAVLFIVLAAHLVWPVNSER